MYIKIINKYKSFSSRIRNFFRLFILDILSIGIKYDFKNY